MIREGVQWVCTINEPNLQPLMTKLHANDPEALAAWNGGPMPVPSEQEVADLIAAHRSATEVVHSVPGVKAGWTVSIADLQFDADGESAAREWFERYEGRFLRAARGDDFVGVQNYFRTTFDRNGLVPVGPVTFERRVKPSARHYSDLVRSRLRTN